MCACMAHGTVGADDSAEMPRAATGTQMTAAHTTAANGGSTRTHMAALRSEASRSHSSAAKMTAPSPEVTTTP